MKEYSHILFKSILLIVFSYMPLQFMAQTKSETKAFLENLQFHNPSEFQNTYYKFFFKSDNLGFSIVNKCPPSELDKNAEDFMVIQQYEPKERKYSNYYLQVSNLRGYKLSSNNGVYYIELQTTRQGNGFFYSACSDSNFAIGVFFLSTGSYDDVNKFLKSMKHFCDLLGNSFVDLSNLF